MANPRTKRVPPTLRPAPGTAGAGVADARGGSDSVNAASPPEVGTLGAGIGNPFGRTDSVSAVAPPNPGTKGSGLAAVTGKGPDQSVAEGPFNKGGLAEKPQFGVPGMSDSGVW